MDKGRKCLILLTSGGLAFGVFLGLIVKSIHESPTFLYGEAFLSGKLIQSEAPPLKPSLVLYPKMEALVSLLKTESPHLQHQKLCEHLSSWTSEDFRTHAVFFNDIDGLNPEIFSESINSFLLAKSYFTAWGRLTPLQAFDFVERESPKHKDFNLYIFLGWAELEPKSALHFTEENFHLLNDIPQVKAHIISQWAQIDLDNALLWLDKHYDLFAPDDIRLIYKSLWSVIAVDNPIKTKERLERLPLLKEHKDQALVALAEIWSRQDSKLALNFLKTLDIKDNEKNKATEAILAQFFERDPMLAFREHEMGGTLYKNPDHYIKINAYLALLYPEKVLKQLEKDPPPLSQEALNPIYRQVTKGFMLQDTSSALSWIKTLHRGTNKDTAIITYASLVTLHDPDLLDLLVTETNNRTNSDIISILQSKIRLWSYNNPSAAEQWIQSSALSDGEKAKLRPYANTYENFYSFP